MLKSLDSWRRAPPSYIGRRTRAHRGKSQISKWHFSVIAMRMPSSSEAL